ncbi:MAG: class I SAM-dependent methyltransferase [Acidobacteria bacterium]|nr:class I SAM-dependent methyltransferase [Acidobacteriota bacterium]
MYESLASVYEEIFSLNPEALAFIQKQLPPPGRDTTVLDIGCATGELCRRLSALGYSVTGAEPDREMLALAKKRSHGKIPFYPIGMEDTGTHFPENSFTAVLCLGNTLAHLQNPNAVQSFFNDVKSLLSPGGRFVFQIVNFDRLSPEHLPEFPVIERNNIRFIRKYEWTENGGAIRFITTLENKSGGTRQTGECRLFPAKQKQLSGALTKAGFSGQSWFGNYKGDPFLPDSPATICVAETAER